MTTLRPGDLDLCDPDVFVTHQGPPHEYLEMLRREDPVHWHPAPSEQKTATPIRKGFWVLTRHEDVKSVSRQPRVFSSQVGTPFLWDMEDDPALPAVQSQLISMDPPQHVKYRRLVQRGFTPKMVGKLEPVIRRHAREAVDRIAATGSCEFVDELACELPLVLICELAGIPVEDRRRIFDWSNRMIGSDDPEMGNSEEGARQAQAEMWIYCNTLVEQKRANPDDTLISRFVHGEVDGEKITEGEINNFFVLLSVAGNETTRNMTSHFMRLMFENPDQYELVKSDVEHFLPGAIEEALRFSPPVINFCRRALEDTEIGGQQVRRGDKVYLCYPSANRDEALFDEPMRFDVTREKNDHIAFGIGEHFCLGANLARMQLRCILREVLTRLPDMTLDGPIGFQRSNFIHGIKRMPVRYTPEA